MKLEGEEGEWELYTGPFLGTLEREYRILMRKKEEPKKSLCKQLEDSLIKQGIEMPLITRATEFLCDHLEALEKKLEALINIHPWVRK